MATFPTARPWQLYANSSIAPADCQTTLCCCTAARSATARISVRQLFSTDRRIASRLTLAHQHERSPWLGRTNRRHYVGEQLMLDF